MTIWTMTIFIWTTSWKILQLSGCEDIWSNFQKATKYCEKIDLLLAFFNSLISSLTSFLLNLNILHCLSVPWRDDANFCHRVFIQALPSFWNSSYPIFTLFRAIPTQFRCLSLNFTTSRKSYWTLNMLQCFFFYFFIISCVSPHRTYHSCD